MAVFVPVLAAAQEPAAMALVRKNYSGAGAVTAAFDLNIYWSVREKDEKKSGELLVAPGNKFKVTLGREVFVCDGQTYWQYNERNKQAAVRAFSEIDPGTLPSRMLSSFLTNRKFTEKSRASGTVEIEWRGSASGQFSDGYTAITAVVEEKAGVIRELKMTDRHENVHTYTFRKTTFDKPPKDDIFRFTAPKGVEVVDMRESNASN
ncbi:MAG: outer membrane lipoprotein carrier protein LolA [Chitinispirillia bacterium]|nr:outer membrane lipoprotein carrier protein LolA [Chitinispirillia bacterium]MCL2241592.1 outer membrane lipoprotein carrier protein LolA [Chitinispirillia bacterium]